MSSITAAPQYVENVNRGYGETWINPDSVKVADDTYATVAVGKSDWLKMQDFDFSALPDTAKITGIELAVHCKGLQVTDDQVYLIYEGVTKGSDRAGCSEWDNNENVHVLGNSSDVWGWNLTPFLVKSQWFGVKFSAKACAGGGGTASVDYTTLTVYYENKAEIVDICNDALSIIGEPAITDIDGTDSRSKICKLNYSPVCKRLLGNHKWLFASHRVELIPAYGCPSLDWIYVYELPSNFLRMLETYPQGGAYELGALNKIYMNEGTGYIKYIADVDDPALFDIYFRTALVYTLALILHPCLVDKATSRQVLQREARYEIARAVKQGVMHQKHTKPTIDWGSEMRI